jgi:hypothetical protein
MKRLVRIAAVVAWLAPGVVACGLSQTGTSVDETAGGTSSGDASADAKTGDGAVDVTKDGGKGANEGGNATTDGGPSDAALDVDLFDGSPCEHGCAASCPEQCGPFASTCTGTYDTLCLGPSSAKCVSSCSSSHCTGASDECNVCFPTGDGGSGAPVKICSVQTTGMCATGNYPHCPCSSQTDCPGDKDVCDTTKHICVPCGETPATQGLRCKCSDSGGSCTASSSSCSGCG